MTTTSEHRPNTAAHREQPPDGHGADAACRGRGRMSLSAGESLMVLLTALLFVGLSYRPLWHTDLWGHLSYGRAIVESGGIPETEPLMALAAGVPFIDTAWLSQLVAYAAFQIAGIAALQFLYAASITTCVALLSWRLLTRTGSPVLSIAGVSVFLGVSWQHLKVIRPQLAGMVLFTLLLVWLTSRRPRRSDYFLVPAVFALWANLHGSFPVGLALIGCFCLGGAADRLVRNRNAASVARDPQVRRYAVLMAGAAAGSLLNPYGPALYAEVLSIARNTNVEDVMEWWPLSLNTRQGQAAAVAAVVLLLLYVLVPKRVSWTEVILLVVFGAASVATSRMLVWWAPLAGYCCGCRARPVWRMLVRNVGPMSRRIGPVWTAATILICGLAPLFTPLGRKTLLSQPPDPAHSLSAQTPVAAVEYLKQHPPRGLLFNSYEWGDYLVWAGPRDLKVFVASHAHLVPTDVWDDYFRVVRVNTGWSETLDRYAVNAMLVDKPRRTGLIDRLRQDRNWKVAYEDGIAVLFERSRLR